MAMLDLNAFQEKTFEVKLLDGTVVELKKPSQKLVIDIMAHEEKMKNKDPKKVLNSFVNIMVEVLNNNTEGREFNRGYVEKYFSLDLGSLFLTAYIDFVKDIQSDPN